MAITANWQFDLNGYTFGPGTSLPGTGSTISITSLTGFDLPEVNSTVSVRSSGHGSTVFARFHKERVIVLQGRLNTSALNYAADTYTLKKIFGRQFGTIPFSFQMPTFPVQFVNVNPLGIRFAVENIATAVGWVDFQATLVAGNPRIYGPTVKSVTLAGSSTVNVTADATNAGNFPAPTVIQFNGPLTNPVLTNVTTGDTFGITAVIAGGTTLTATSIDQTLFNGTTSSYSLITPTSTPNPTGNVFIELAGVTNRLSLNPAGTGNVVVTYRDTWL